MRVLYHRDSKSTSSSRLCPRVVARTSVQKKNLSDGLLLLAHHRLAGDPQFPVRLRHNQRQAISQYQRKFVAQIRAASVGPNARRTTNTGINLTGIHAGFGMVPFHLARPLRINHPCAAQIGRAGAGAKWKSGRQTKADSKCHNRGRLHIVIGPIRTGGGLATYRICPAENL
jgi:hypothetical protein